MNIIKAMTNSIDSGNKGGNSGGGAANWKATDAGTLLG